MHTDMNDCTAYSKYIGLEKTQLDVIRYGGLPKMSSRRSVKLMMVDVILEKMSTNYVKPPAEIFSNENPPRPINGHCNYIGCCNINSAARYHVIRPWWLVSFKISLWPLYELRISIVFCRLPVESKIAALKLDTVSIVPTQEKKNMTIVHWTHIFSE